MKIRHYQLYTFNLCDKWLRNKTPKNKKKMIFNLNKWAHSYNKYANDDYGYEAETFDALYWHVSYCSDRMNPGRAKALIRLFNQFGE